MTTVPRAPIAREIAIAAHRGHRSLALAFCACLLLGACFDDAPASGGPDIPVVGPDVAPLPRLSPDAADTADVPEDGRPDADAADTADMGADPTADGGADCGNGAREPGEACDDGNTSNEDFCLNSCTLACGDGRVNAVESCDVAIPAGRPGACPTTCNDGVACTADVRSGSACQIECVFQPITARVSGDGCCPEGADANTDTDCAAVCGNGLVEAPAERCDTALAAGQPGACPQGCADGLACTSDHLLDAGTCLARCRFDPISAIGPADGCCPTGGHAGEDPDCGESCGDGFVDSPQETCDVAIPANESGACPTGCPSADACLVRELLAPGTCTAACSDTFITEPGPADGCCPFGGNANLDPDCNPSCGNGIVEEGENCDEGPVLPANGCDVFCHLEADVATAFHVDGLGLRAPHLFADLPFLGCQDVTDVVNGLLDDAVTSDGNGDGFIDLSVLVVFRPLAQATAGGDLDVALGLCAPDTEPTCTVDPGTPVQPVTYDNRATGTCLAPIPGTFDPDYSPPITPVTAESGPCFMTETFSLTLEFQGITIPLEDATMAANYAGNPALSLENGLLQGFLSEAAADAVVLPADLPVVGGQSLSAILAGDQDCSELDDRVTDGPPDDGTTGWWLYLNFSAARADLIE